MKYFLLSVSIVLFSLGNAHASVPVPYAGKVSIDGKNFHGQLKFMFAIYTASNDMVWDSGGSAIEVPVTNGRYLVLLGGQGMRPLPASLFHQNDELYVGVYADLPNDNVGQVKLGELQRITAQPYALVAEMAKSADTVKAGAITTAQLNEQILKYLKPEITHKPNVVGVALEGQSVTLNAQAEGKYLSYQWYKNDQPIPGAVKNRYVINDVNKSLDDGNYSLLVSNEIGSIRSDYVRLEVGKHVIDLNATVSMDMIWCPPGTFTMGSPTTEAGRQSDREDEHNVSLTKGFYLGKYEVTQAQYEAVMTGVTGDRNATPSNWHGNPDRPVEKVSWDDAQVFLTRLNEQQADNLPAGWSYVLPTESQWEYACRAGTTTVYSWGDGIASSNANYHVSGYSQTRDVGQYSANPWGFFDMHGNAWEWTADWYQAAYPSGNPVIDPTGPASGSFRVIRGGSWYDTGASSRSSYRNVSHVPSDRGSAIGFRVGFQAIQPDTANPELELFGGAAITREAGQAWAEPGVEAHDARDGNITDQIVVTGTVDMNSTGTYLLTYTIQDEAGNTATTTRTVTVVGNRSVDLNATVAMDMIWCPPGTFTMGSPTTEAGRQADREDEHNVSLTQGFYLGKYEVTQAQYEAVMTGNTNSLSPTPSNWPNNPIRPVEKVSWDDAQVFLTRLNAQQAGNLPAGWSYVLPTESQWEYACRAGTTTAYSWGATIISSNANYNWDGGANDGNDFKQTRDVGQYAANPWGFFDMHGNVWEWTADWYQAAYPSGNPVIDPTGPASGSFRVIRGGSWYDTGASSRSSYRNVSHVPSDRGSAIGFRVGFQQQ